MRKVNKKKKKNDLVEKLNLNKKKDDTIKSKKSNNSQNKNNIKNKNVKNNVKNKNVKDNKNNIRNKKSENSKNKKTKRSIWKRILTILLIMGIEHLHFLLLNVFLFRLGYHLFLLYNIPPRERIIS